MGFFDFFKRQQKEFKRQLRRYPRIKSFNLVKAELTRPGAEKCISNMIDISEGGLKIVYIGDITTGDRIMLQINLAEIKQIISVEGEVRWVNQVPRHKNSYHAGIQFVNISEIDRNAIRTYFKSKTN